MTRQIGISRWWIALTVGVCLSWAYPSFADEPVPPGPGVIINVAGLDEPSSPDPDTNCTGTDPVTCATLREAIMFANGNTAAAAVEPGAGGTEPPTSKKV